MIEVIGPVVDVEFAEGVLPEIYNAIEVVSEGYDSPQPIRIITEVQYHLGEKRVRTISMHPTDGLVRGMKAYDTGGPITVPVGREVLGRIINVIGEPVDGLGPINEKKRYPIHRPPRRSRSRRPNWSCSRPGSRSSTCSSPICGAERSACSAAPASARRSSSRS